MKKFEYRVIESRRRENPMEWLDKAGAQGWELVQVVLNPETGYDNERSTQYFFKREARQRREQFPADPLPECITG